MQIRRILTIAAAGLMLAWTATAASAEVKTKPVDYTVNGTALQGMLAWDDAASGKRPAVIVVPEWWGVDERMKSVAKELAQAGYVAFVADMYGKGKVADYAHPKDAEAFMNEALKAPAEIGARFSAAEQQLKSDAHVNTAKIAAIGYCFGGGVILNAARRGEPLVGVVSFHGMLAGNAPAKPGAVKARILVLTGADDPMAPAAQVEAFKKEMTAAGAKFDVVSYPGAKHAFTNPDVGQAKMDALAYDADAAKKSWAAMLAFFKQVFA